jgi:predicted nucleotidyltransferase
MRISNYLKNELIKATKEAFGECRLILFGSRVDNSKKGGDFDIAVVKDITKEEFKKAKVKFFKYLLLKDLDLPIDLVLYNKASELLKKEIDKKGEILLGE